MNLPTILAAGSPLIQIHKANEIEMFKQIVEAERSTAPKVVSRSVRSWKCGTAPDFFREVGAAWQFAHSFKETWTGFAEELSDLAWWPADAYLFVVMRAVKFLDGEPASALKDFADAAAFGRTGALRGPTAGAARRGSASCFRRRRRPSHCCARGSRPPASILTPESPKKKK